MSQGLSPRQEEPQRGVARPNGVAPRQTCRDCPINGRVRAESEKGPGQAMVSATAFTQHYEIDTTATRRWRPFVEDGMLCIDLTQTGTVIEDNRAKNRTPSTPDAGTGHHLRPATTP
jgi:hypothetical protein